MSGEPPSTRWSARWRRRRTAAVVAAALPVLAVLATLYLVEPAYRASASLRVEGRSMAPELAEAAAREEIVQYVRGLGGAAGLEVKDVAVRTDANGRRSTSLDFDIVAYDRDPRAAQRVVAETVEQYVAIDEQARGVTVNAPPALEEARLATERLAAESSAIEADLDAFERANAGVLGAAVDREVVERAEASLAQARSDTLQLERQLAELEARRVELDRGLRDMQAASNGARDETSISSEALAALQTQWAILRGRYGRDHAPAAEVARRIERIRGEADRRLTAVTTELEQARAELARLEQIHTIEHPDVVAQAHKLSAMESRFGSLRVQGLTNAEIAYIEGVAQERRDIDARIAEVQQRRADLAAIIAEHEARAATAPLLRQQHLALEQKLLTAQQNHEAARSLQMSLEAELAALRAQQPGRLSVVSAPQARRTLISRPGAMLALGAALAFLAALVVVTVMELIDRRIAGKASIRRVLGDSALVVEIPVIAAAASGGGTRAERLAA